MTVYMSLLLSNWQPLLGCNPSKRKLVQRASSDDDEVVVGFYLTHAKIASIFFVGGSALRVTPIPTVLY